MTRLANAYVIGILLFVVTIGGIACSDRSSPAREADPNQLQGRLIMTGSSTLAPLVSQIAKRFEQVHPKVRIDVQTGGSSRGIADARRGTADIGMASRPLSEHEQQEMVPYVIARDGVCVIVHANNPVRELTDRQIRDIYTGKINHWHQIAGPNAQITVVDKAAGRATREVFVKHFKIDSKTIQADLVIGDNEHGIKTVAGNPHAVGYVSLGAAQSSAQRGVPVKLLPVGGVEASTANLAAGRFVIDRPLVLVTPGPAHGLASAFIDYCRSEQVHDVVRDMSFVPAGREGQ